MLLKATEILGPLFLYKELLIHLLIKKYFGSMVKTDEPINLWVHQFSTCALQDEV